MSLHNLCSYLILKFQDGLRYAQQQCIFDLALTKTLSMQVLYFLSSLYQIHFIYTNKIVKRPLFEL